MGHVGGRTRSERAEELAVNGRARTVVGLVLAVAGCGGLSTYHPETSSSAAAGSPSAGAGAIGSLGGTGGATGGSPTTGNAGRAGHQGFAPGEPSEVVAPTPIAYANFGTSVALWGEGSGDTLAVGAPGPVGEAGGDAPFGAPIPDPAVYVYELQGDTWVEEALLTVPYWGTPPSESGFATTLALEDGTLVVGAPRQDPPGARDGALGAGRVYVFERADGWHLAATLTPSTYHEHQTFGSAVALSGTVIAVADPSDDGYRGAVTLFEQVEDQWVETTVIRAQAPVSGSSFGSGVALDDGTLAVAASGSQSVHLMAPSQPEWIVAPSATPPAANFANRIALDGDTLVVASYTESSNATGVNGTPGAPYPSDGYFSVSSGAAYVYRRGDNGWVEEAFLKSAHPQVQGLFGWDLALHGDTLLVAERQSSAAGVGYVAQGEVASGNATRGAVWVFQRAGTTWSLEGVLKSPSGETAFASSVGALAISERFVAVGAFADPTTPVDASAVGTPYAGGVFVWPW